MIHEGIVPKWDLSHQRQERVEGEQTNRSSHVHTHYQLQNPTTTSPIVPMSNGYEVAELTRENGQLTIHGLGGLLHNCGQTKPTWVGTSRTSDTLESIVHQATTHSSNNNKHNHRDEEAKSTTVVASSNQAQMDLLLMKKRARSESNQCGGSRGHENVERGAGATASATFCRELSDTSMMTYTSFESTPSSFKPKTTDNEDSASHGASENQAEDGETKTETVRSHPSRRTRAAAIHNQSERRRRDRINQKMKALQKLVPNASKTDKASMLDEVIEYLKQLQAQVQVISSVRNNMPHMNMMIPLGLNPHLHQMSILSRMGMLGFGLGMGLGIQDINAVPHTRPQSLPSQLVHPPPPPQPPVAALPPFVVPDNAAHLSTSVPLPDPYCNFWAQSMNMDLYNKMAALYRQQVNQTTQATSNPPQLNHVQGDQQH